MKIAVIVPTRNEAKNIERFCRSYAWADCILVADTMSEDDTVWLASAFPNVFVRTFDRVEVFPNGVFRTEQNKVNNFLTRWAAEEQADWAILDDCDCVPNVHLKRDGRRLLEECEEDTIFTPRLFPWLDTGKFFTGLALRGDKWLKPLYAWRLSCGLTWNEDIPYHGTPLTPLDGFAQKHIEPPYCRLHYTWPTVEEVQRKLAFYHAHPIEKRQRMLHPTAFGGPLADLPDWAVE